MVFCNHISDVVSGVGGIESKAQFAAHFEYIVFDGG